MFMHSLLLMRPFHGQKVVNVLFSYDMYMITLYTRVYQKVLRLDLQARMYYFFMSATTHVDSWLSRQFSSIHGDPELVPSI